MLQLIIIFLIYECQIPWWTCLRWLFMNRISCPKPNDIESKKDIRHIKTAKLHIWKDENAGLSKKQQIFFFTSTNFSDFCAAPEGGVVLMLICGGIRSLLNVLKHAKVNKGNFPFGLYRGIFFSLFWSASMALFEGLQAKHLIWDSTKNSGPTSNKRKEWSVPSASRHRVNVVVLYGWWFGMTLILH